MPRRHAAPPSAHNWSVTSPPNLPRACSATFRNFNCAWAALESCGYRRIGFFTNPGISIRTEHQYVAAHLMKLHLLPPERRVSALSVPPEKLNLATLRAWLDQERPDAVLVDDAHYMLPLLAQAANVPADLGVAALELSNAPAGMAGIDEHSEEIGAAAVDMLIGRLQRNECGMPGIPRLLHVPGSWRDGLHRAPARAFRCGGTAIIPIGPGPPRGSRPHARFIRPVQASPALPPRRASPARSGTAPATAEPTRRAPGRAGSRPPARPCAAGVGARS